MDRETGGAREIWERRLLDPSADPTDLPLWLLNSITKDFSGDREIGSGGFASVYKGILSNGSTVAVKRLSPAVDLDEKSFNREVTSLIKVKHDNVVRFLGFCGETKVKVGNYEGKVVMTDMRQRLLCFEFMPNGGLDKYINVSEGEEETVEVLSIEEGNLQDPQPEAGGQEFEQAPECPNHGPSNFRRDASRGLDWRTRYQIIKGICKGLHYLHQQNIVHSDLKPANILLDQHMVPKIADFGLAKCFDKTQTQAMTKNISGSLGYMAPEFIYKGEITLKSDIFSLGVVINEILTGGRGSLEIENVLENWRSRFETSKESTRLEHVKLCAEIGIKCSDYKSVKRPKASDIMEMLDAIDSRYGETGSCTSPATYELEAEEKPQISLDEKQQENQDLLIKCVSQDLGFSSGKPIAACLIYRCLVHWRSFEVERTGVFDRIIQTIGSAIESQDNNDKLAYWLSNSSTLLVLLQRTLKTMRLIPQRRRSSAASFGRVFSGMRASPQSAGRAFLGSRLIGQPGDLRQVEAKYPALFFKEQLTVFLEKIYGMIRDNLKKEVAPLLGLCMQAPRASRASMEGSRFEANAFHLTLIVHWEGIVKILTKYLNGLNKKYVPSFIISKVFTQIFSFINVQLFNSLLLRRECCSFSNGEYVKAGLAELAQWCIYAGEKYVGCSWQELRHIREAVGFLVIHQKPMKTLEEITNDFCPVLTIQQLYRISTLYSDDKYGTHTVSSDVISSLRVMMTEDSNDVESSSFLLDDDSSIPFTVDDISKSMTEIEVTDIDMPPMILENSGFTFLHQRKD